MSASGFDAGLIINTELATTRIDSDRDLWSRLYVDCSFIHTFLVLATTQHCEWDWGKHSVFWSDVEKTCFTWRGQEG